MKIWKDHQSVQSTPVGQKAKMQLIASRLMPNGSYVERKCSLLAKIILDKNDHNIYTPQVRDNLAHYLSRAEKVKVRVSKAGVTVFDRNIWQNKIEKIPAELLCDCHVDRSSPKICYIIAQSFNKRFMVLALLCKSAGDSYRLVEACPSSAVKPISWYANQPQTVHLHKNTLSHSQPSHSIYKQDSSPGNKSHQHGWQEQPPYTSTIQQYESDDTPNSSMKKNQVSDIIVNEDNMAPATTNGLTMVMTPTQSPNNTLHRVTRSAKSSHTQHQRSKSQPRLSGKTNKQTSGALHVIPNPPTDSWTGSVGRQSKRKMGPYGSIAEYEKSNGTISSRGSSALHISGRENRQPVQYMKSRSVPPQRIMSSQQQQPTSLTLVMKGDQYSIQQPSQVHQSAQAAKMSVQTKSSRSPHPTHNGISYNNQTQQRSMPNNQVAIITDVTQPPANPLYDKKRYGKGDNYFENEHLKVDDDHQYYRQHGQRVKQTDDGGQKLYVDSRISQTNDVVGNQIVAGEHAQKVHAGESVGANHRSKFHNETRVSHSVSKPLQNGAIEAPPAVRRTNSRPVNVTTHQWPGIDFGLLGSTPQQPPALNLTQPNFQRFYRPEFEMNTNPGFQRFFDSIQTYGPPQGGMKNTDGAPQSRQLAIEPSELPGDVKNRTSRIESTTKGDNESETSSIRSSASAYWPPELKFTSAFPQQPISGVKQFPHPKNYHQMKLRKKKVPAINSRPHIAI